MPVVEHILESMGSILAGRVKTEKLLAEYRIASRLGGARFGTKASDQLIAPDKRPQEICRYLVCLHMALLGYQNEAA